MAKTKNNRQIYQLPLLIYWSPKNSW